MGRIRGIAATLFTLAVIVALARADDVALRARLQAAYDTQCADLVHRDFDALQDTMSPSYVSHENGVTTTRATSIANIKSFDAQGVAFTSCETTIDSVAQSGDLVDATMHQVVYGTADKGRTPLVFASGDVETWSGANGATLLEVSSNGIWGLFAVNGRITREFGPVPSPLPLPSPTPTKF